MHAYTHAHAAGARHGRAILWLEAVERRRWKGFGRLGLPAGKNLLQRCSPCRAWVWCPLNEEPPQATSAPRRTGMVPVLVSESTPAIRQPVCVCAKPRVLLPERGRADFLHPRCLAPQSLCWPQPEAQPWFLSTVLRASTSFQSGHLGYLAFAFAVLFIFFFCCERLLLLALQSVSLLTKLSPEVPMCGVGWGPEPPPNRCLAISAAPAAGTSSDARSQSTTGALGPQFGMPETCKPSVAAQVRDLLISAVQCKSLNCVCFILHQDGEEEFNRAKLLNIGFTEALKEYDYDCFVFSDVDLIPMDDRNTYKCYSQPRHLSVSMDKFGFR